MLKIKLQFDSNYSYEKTLNLIKGRCKIIKEKYKKRTLVIGVEDEDHFEQLRSLISVKISNETFYSIIYKK